LLTGNVIEGARAKLQAVGIDPAQFIVGAFGSDHEIRSELPAIARQRTLETLGHDLTGPDIIIIGDTPSDVRCGQAVGARAIGVGTGHYSAADLLEVGAFAAFDDLTDTEAVVAAILAA
jgi:phosphoglycolate phosphatase-like HAD superfamily hydrolase